MNQALVNLMNKWKWNGVFIIGGLLIGAGVADCIISIKKMDLNQIARGLTIFSAGLTILVVMDSSKTQKKAELVQQETQARLKKIEQQLHVIAEAQKMTHTQFADIKKLLQNEEKIN